MTNQLADEVGKVIEQRDGLSALCGEMLAMLTLSANQPLIGELARLYKATVDGWQKEFDRLTP